MIELFKSYIDSYIREYSGLVNLNLSCMTDEEFEETILIVAMSEEEKNFLKKTAWMFLIKRDNKTVEVFSYGGMPFRIA